MDGLEKYHRTACRVQLVHGVVRYVTECQCFLGRRADLAFHEIDAGGELLREGTSRVLVFNVMPTSTPILSAELGDSFRG